MRKIVLLKYIGFGFVVSMGLVLSFSKKTQTLDEIYLDKVQTIDSTISIFYDVISGEKGESRNWELFKYLFHPEGKLINYAPNKEGTWETRFRTPEEYINTSGKYLQKTGFYEKELYKKVDSFGSIATVISTYESYFSKSDEKPFMRGFNSFQLLNDGKRWWIINNYWVRETSDNPIPEKFLKKENN